MSFRPRFPLGEVPDWADRYEYADDAEVIEYGRRAGARGRYTRAGFLAIARWKARGRTRHLCEQNSEAEVRRATGIALSTSDERQRLAALVALRGVGVPTASVLLHLALDDAFPIIDFRALWSLGVDEPPAVYSFEYWWAYVEACRSLREQAGVTMRRFDRALWQFSNERQPRRSGVRTPGRRRRPVRARKESGREEVMDKDFTVEAYTRLVAAAIEGRLIPYSEVAGRGQVGKYLYAIADYEKAHGRPPLTAIVIHKQDGKPGKGFRIAMEQVGYARPGESDDALWERAVADVLAYWDP